YVCLFASCGHVNNTTHATWFGTDNIMDFWEDVLQMEANEITRNLEQWACVSGHSMFVRYHAGSRDRGVRAWLQLLCCTLS
ncbi:uncharacterized protein EDB91DRAFT_1061221, partial [Suillus paluster]|uniref:uncharacterized protein n=1 Tax=Suillus paluster TaxID=48578 RepID=UPI001B86E4F5